MEKQTKSIPIWGLAISMETFVWAILILFLRYQVPQYVNVSLHMGTLEIFMIEVERIIES